MTWYRHRACYSHGYTPWTYQYDESVKPRGMRGSKKVKEHLYNEGFYTQRHDGMAPSIILEFKKPTADVRKLILDRLVDELKSKALRYATIHRACRALDEEELP